MSDVAPIRPFAMLPGAGPACEGNDCLPTAPALQQTGLPAADS